MNSKIIISISVIITISIVIFSLTQNDVIKNQTSLEIENPSEIKNSLEIENMLNKIKQEKIKNDNSEKPYFPADREWISSGPFQIDRSEYNLGEKIFVNIDQINPNDKGKVVFLRPINSTHYLPYHTMPFDGSGIRNNYYLTPDLSALRGICTVDQLAGDWIITFDGTMYPNLEFELLESKVPGYEGRYDPVC